MNAILIFPEYPDTFWSYKRALKFISKKATFPPLGLMTVASLLPKEWNLRLVDTNVSPLKDEDFDRSDIAFLSAISIQKTNAEKIIARCKERGVRIVAGGPLFTTDAEGFPDADHLVLGEAEITMPLFLKDLAKGAPRRVYASSEWADITKTPLPLRSLINPRHYSAMNLQYSRGCPFNCEFCDITLLYGRQTRTKDVSQIIAELDDLHSRGWRGSVFFVDDNFIGNKQKLKTEVLPAIVRWMKEHNYPFSFNTQASVNIGDDDELIALLGEAGFNTVFVGIETPNEASLTECTKYQNKKRDLVAFVKKMHRRGLEVQAGFIVGFDNDPRSIFESQIRFIQESGIVTAMVGLLNALRGTRLHQRLEKENRLLDDYSGDNTDYSINFTPKMGRDALIEGYRRIISTIYTPANYYARVRQFLKEYRPAGKRTARVHLVYISALIKSVFVLGIAGKERRHYWRLLLWTLFRRPALFPLAVSFAICGFHYRKVFEKNP